MVNSSNIRYLSRFSGVTNLTLLEYLGKLIANVSQFVRSQTKERTRCYRRFLFATGTNIKNTYAVIQNTGHSKAFLYMIPASFIN